MALETFQTKNLTMNRNQIIEALHFIQEGKSIRDTEIPINEKNVIQWHELQQEMSNGYMIDLPLNNEDI